MTTPTRYTPVQAAKALSTELTENPAACGPMTFSAREFKALADSAGVSPDEDGYYSPEDVEKAAENFRASEQAIVDDEERDKHTTAADRLDVGEALERIIREFGDDPTGVVPGNARPSFYYAANAVGVSIHHHFDRATGRNSDYIDPGDYGKVRDELLKQWNEVRNTEG